MIEAIAENAYTGDYPLAASSTSTSTTSRAPQLDPLRREFIRYVFSKQGQEVVVKDGYYPLRRTRSPTRRSPPSASPGAMKSGDETPTGTERIARR